MRAHPQELAALAEADGVEAALELLHALELVAHGLDLRAFAFARVFSCCERAWARSCREVAVCVCCVRLCARVHECVACVRACVRACVCARI